MRGKFGDDLQNKGRRGVEDSVQGSEPRSWEGGRSLGHIGRSTNWTLWGRCPACQNVGGGDRWGVRQGDQRAWESRKGCAGGGRAAESGVGGSEDGRGSCLCGPRREACLWLGEDRAGLRVGAGAGAAATRRTLPTGAALGVWEGLVVGKEIPEPDSGGQRGQPISQATPLRLLALHQVLVCPRRSFHVPPPRCLSHLSWRENTPSLRSAGAAPAPSYNAQHPAY